MKTIPPEVHTESQDSLERVRRRFVELHRPLVVYLIDAALAAIEDEAGSVPGEKDRQPRND